MAPVGNAAARASPPRPPESGPPPGPSAIERPVAARAEALPPADRLPQPGLQQGGAPKAAIIVGDFQVRAANAGQQIGDGLREMLVTALHNSGRFVVVERMDLRGLAAEQALSRSRMARPGDSIPEGQMEIADVAMYGAVTEFEPEVRGGGLAVGMGNIPLTLGVQTKSAHMAIDVRLVDVASGRILATGRVAGEARAAAATIGANISARGVNMPATLTSFQNTPMEQAIRECIEKATAYAAGNTSPAYFHHH
jgi:curli biogenesis system outer membrane secretion channel CsgG